MEINTHNLIIGFGKYKGERWTRVPVSYLSWLANQKEENENTLIAKAEIERRGSKYPIIEISVHAIDNTSIRCLSFWEQRENKREGIHTWLQTMSLQARELGTFDGEKYSYKGMKFVFEEGTYYPCLKTVMRVS